MSVDIVAALAELFPDVLQYQVAGSETISGDTTQGAVNEASCRICGKVQMITAQDGRERVSKMYAIVAGTPGLTVDHLYTLPIRFAPRVLKALAVGYWTDENGPCYEVVYF